MRVTLHPDVDLRWHGKEGQWELLSPVVCAVDRKDIVVPPGFRTDLASIPRAVRSITPQVGKHIPAAIVHDWLYKMGERSRKEADKIFLAAMKHLGVYGLRRWAMYGAVRGFGWMAWGK